MRKVLITTAAFAGLYVPYFVDTASSAERVGVHFRDSTGHRANSTTNDGVTVTNGGVVGVTNGGVTVTNGSVVGTNGVTVTNGGVVGVTNGGVVGTNGVTVTNGGVVTNSATHSKPAVSGVSGIDKRPGRNAQ